MHPDDVARPLAKIVQSILRDAASLIDPEEGRKTISTAENTKGPKQEGRKTKRARLFESDQVMSNRRRTSPAEAELIHHSLTCKSDLGHLMKAATLTLLATIPALLRIILHGAWLFPASLLNQTLRLLLAYGLSGQFFNAVPDFSPNALLSEGLSYYPAIRTSILHCLLATLQSIAKEAHGVLELALGVFNKGLASPTLDEEGRRICAQAVGMFDNLLRPVVPPLVKSAALRQATRDLTGGSVLGKEADFMDQEDEPIRAYATDAETAGIEAVQPQNQQGLSSFSMAGLNRSTQPLAPSQPISFQSAAAPSAKDVSFSSLGQVPFNKASASEVSSPINSTSNAKPAVETVVTEATSVIVQTSAPAAAAKETSSSTKRTLEEDPEEDAGSEDITEEHEDEPRVWRGGGKQAELAAVKWDAEDSDTSDDDAPMPKIYMSDDDEEGGDDDEDEDEQKDAAR